MALSLSVWIYLQLGTRVGDIPVINNAEAEEFSPCHEHSIYQYYQINTGYIGGKRAIKWQLKQIFPINTLTESGLLTIRFVVNCEGKTGYYRPKMIDSSLQEIDLSNKNLTEIFNAISALDKWVPGLVGDQPVDSYHQISFKLLEGEVIDIF